MEASRSVELTPAPTLVGLSEEKAKLTVSEPEIPALANAKQLRKYVLLAIFCLGQFLDTMNNSAMFPAIPAVSHEVGLTESDSVWLFAAYQATFASFLLIVCHVLFVYSDYKLI
jgi:hypothetical protein